MSTTIAARKDDDRIVLLLDLDCFYASCECVRLGLDAQSTPLAVMQWNSVLAVTYPARTLYQIKRGDSWEVIRQKCQQQEQNSSAGGDQAPHNAVETTATTNHQQVDNKESVGCYTVHVPILTLSSTEDASTTAAQDSTTTATASAHAADSAAATLILPDLSDDYPAIYQLSAPQQLQARQQSLGVRYHQNQGKACIERYRVASAQIFETVLEWIQTKCPTVILERASIDEFFLDVTLACRNDAAWQNVTPQAVAHAVQETAQVGSTTQVGQDDLMPLEFQRACWIAYSIRQTVHQQLGFTMSCGMSINKMLAKLSAGHGKPNGQALTPPNGIVGLLQNTSISSCRNLGGKLGKQVQALLPKNVPDTVGSIAQYLSSSTLKRELGDETARWVHDIARGIDHEPVVAKNEAALTKSITAFKSLPFHVAGHSITQAAAWIRLLAQEVVLRVEKDATRNARYPQHVTIQYSGQQNNKSIRSHFPAQRLSMPQKIDDLVDRTISLIQTKEGKNYRISRVGLCAVDFASRQTQSHGIEHYFSAAKASKQTAKPAATNTDQQHKSVSTRKSTEDADLELAKKLQANFDPENGPTSSDQQQQQAVSTTPSTEDADLEFAKKLQANFDRENRLLQAVERRSSTSSQGQSKTRKIDSFFRKR